MTSSLHILSTLESIPVIVLHAGHFDPVSSDPLISFSIRAGIAAVAGGIAAGAMLLPVYYLWDGDVVPLLFIASLTNKPIPEISNRDLWFALSIVGILLGVFSQSLAIAIFGLPAIVFMAFDVIPLQVLAASITAGGVLFIGVGFVLIPQYQGEISSKSGIRWTWLFCTGVFVIAYILARMGLFTLFYGR